MIIYEYKQVESTLLYADKSDGIGKLIREFEAKQTYKEFNKSGDVLSVGDVVYVNKYGAMNKQRGFKVEITSFDIDNSPISERIKQCDSLNELDGLRIEIAKDKDNFLTNQELFKKAKSRIKREGKNI